MSPMSAHAPTTPASPGLGFDVSVRGVGFREASGWDSDSGMAEGPETLNLKPRDSDSEGGMAER